MAKRASLVFLGVASPLLALAFVTSGGLVSVGWVAALAVLSPVALLTVGIARAGRELGGAGRYLVALAVVLVGSVSGALFASPEPLVIGLPAGALWMLGGLWIAPLLLLGWAYPRTFARAVLDRDDLRRLEGLTARSLPR